jgi:predicted  nucleic acid-binding Zn-ribbon protein
MSRTALERQLTDVSERLRARRGDLDVAEEQLQHFTDIAEETRLRALVSETPLADREHQDAERHAAAMRRHRQELVDEITELEQRQDVLLDKLLADGTR